MPKRKARRTYLGSLRVYAEEGEGATLCLGAVFEEVPIEGARRAPAADERGEICPVCGASNMGELKTLGRICFACGYAVNPPGGMNGSRPAGYAGGE